MTLKSSWSVIIAVVLLLAGLGGGCTSDKDRMEGHIERGDALLAEGDFEGAEAEYRSAVRFLPDNPEVFGRLGVLAVRQGRTLSGYFLLQGTIERVPDNLDMQLAYALANHALARNTEARAAARKVLERQPGNEEALLLMAQTSVTTRDLAESRRLINEAREASTDTAAHHVALGMLHRVEGKTDEAEREYRAALELDPRSAAAYAELGTLLIRRGDNDAGGAAMKQAADFSPLRSPRRIRYIEHLIRTGARDLAKQELAKITDPAPDYVPAWVVRMKLAFQEEDFDTSLEAAGKVLALDRTNYEAMMQRAAIRLVRGDMAGVLFELENAESYYERSPQVKYQLALAHLKQGDTFQAEEKVKEALRISPNYDEAILLLAELDLRRDNPGATVAALRELLRRRPDQPQAYLLLAQAHRSRGDLDLALEVLQRLAAGYPASPHGPNTVGLTLLDMDRMADARRAFEEAVRRAPTYWPALERLIDLDLVEGKREAAVERAEALVRDHPDQASPWIFRAKVRLLQQDVSGAESDLLHALEVDPRNQYPYVVLARIYAETNRAGEAVGKLAALAAQEPSVSNLMQLGMLHTSMRQHEEARQQYEKVLEQAPDFPPALNNLAALYVELDQLDKAYGLAKKARESAPNDPVIADTLGWIHHRMGQHHTAMPLLQEAAQKLSSDPLIRYHLGVTQYTLGREQEARQSLGNVVASVSDAEVKADAERRLAILAIDVARADASVRARLQAAVEQDPGDPIALSRLAALEVREGELQTAATRYEQALKVNSRSAPVMMALVDLYFGPLSNRERARELAKLLHVAAPNDGEVTWRLGTHAFRIGDFAEATALLQEAARFLPREPRLLMELAQAYYSVGRVKEAVSTLDDVLQLAEVEDLRVRANRMKALVAATDDPERASAALAEARAALASEPGYVPALMVLAMEQERTQDFEAARDTYEKVLATYSSFAPAQRQLAVLYGEQFADDEKAEKLALQARQSQPDDPEVNYQLGVICYRRGDYEDAVRYLRQSVRHRERHAQAHFVLGMCYYQLKNLDEGRTALQAALRYRLPPHEEREASRVLEMMNRGGI